MNKIFGREPALWLATFAALVQFLSAQVLDLSVGQQGALNAVAVAVVGAVTAWRVSAEKGVPALVGVLQALLALGLAFGLDMSSEAQSTLMALVTALASLWVRTQVVAPVPPAPSAAMSARAWMSDTQ
jgi:hypothetical protein